MLKLLVVATSLVVSCSAYDYGFYGGGSYGGANHQTSIAVQTRHTVRYFDVPSSGPVKPTTVKLAYDPTPIKVIFRTNSSKVYVEPFQKTASGSQKKSFLSDPQQLIQEMKKPVIPKNRKVIKPSLKTKAQKKTLAPTSPPSKISKREPASTPLPAIETTTKQTLTLTPVSKLELETEETHTTLTLPKPISIDQPLGQSKKFLKPLSKLGATKSSY